MARVNRLRIRAFLDRQFALAVLVLVVLAGVGGVLTYDAYAQPNTTVQTNEVTVWEADGSFTHGATVVDNETKTAGAFEPGATVQNRSVYFQSIMPVLNGTFRYGYAADSGELDATVRSRLVVRSVGSGRERPIEYWRQTRSLGREEVTLAPGERVRVPFSVNVTEAAATADQVRERVGDPGQTRASVNVTVALTGTAGGREIDRTLQYALPVRIEGGVYRVDEAASTRAFTQPERVTVTESPGPLSAYGAPGLLALSLSGLVALAAARRGSRLTLTDTERAWVAYRDDRADFDDWISTVRLPAEAESLPVGEAGTLADLVNVAIDTDNAVLESPDGDTYHVVHDDFRYTFTAPSAPIAADSVPRASADTVAEGSVRDESNRGRDDGQPTTSAPSAAEERPD